MSFWPAATVDTLRGTLESDVHEAAEACWTMTEKEVSVRGKLKINRRLMRHQQARFVDEAETQLLGAALGQWQSAAEGSVASGGLSVRVAERRLLHAVHRWCKQQIAL